MTLHEAIFAVLSKHGLPMKAADISQQINRFLLYQSKTGNPVSPNQIWARVNKYRNLFQVTDDKKISILSENFIQEEEFLKWVRNYLVHNYSVNSDIVIPFLVYFIRHSSKEDNLSSKPEFYFDFLNENNFNFKREVLGLVDKLYATHLSNSSYHVVKLSFEQLDEINLRNILKSLERFSSFISHMVYEDFIKLFVKLITQVSGTKSRGFEFGTPDIIAEFIGHLVDVKSGQSIYDPFAGLCILLSKVVAGKKDIKVFANDISDRAGTVGILNLIINGVSDFQFAFNDAIRNNELRYDWIVSNPPFNRSPISKVGDIEIEDIFQNPVFNIYNLLKKDGKAIVVVPDSFLYTEDRIYRRLRGELTLAKAIKAVISLPNGIFQPYSGIATSILYIDKSSSHNDVFFVDFSNITKDELGFKLEEFSSIVKRQKELDKIARFVNYDFIIRNEQFNLLPRKNILQTIAAQDYIKGGVPLRELIEKRIPGVSISSANINEEQDGVPYLRISDLSDEQFSPYITSRPSRSISDIEEMHSLKLIEDDCIAIAKVGNKLKPSIYKFGEPAVVGGNILCFSVKKDKIFPEFLVNELNSDYVKEQLDAIQIRGIGPNSYRERDLLDLRIIVPPIADQQKDFGLKKKGIKEFWGKFKEGINDIFQDGEPKLSLEKSVKEVEIISSIKHRIAQYVSPVSSDLQNLDLYFSKKRIEGSPVTENDKISGRENALSVAEVFKRMETNLQSIGETFDVMKNILYFNKEESKFAPENIKNLVHESYESVKELLKDVVFTLSIDDLLKEQDLVIPVDKRQISELLRNFFINSNKHGFDDTIPKKVISVFITKGADNNFLEINLINNGKPFPDGFTIGDYIAFGRKGTDSTGTGIGGYLMKKIIDNHEGKLDWLGDENLRFSIEDENWETITSIATIHFKISLPYINN